MTGQSPIKSAISPKGFPLESDWQRLPGIIRCVTQPQRSEILRTPSPVTGPLSAQQAEGDKAGRVLCPWTRRRMPRQGKKGRRTQ